MYLLDKNDKEILKFNVNLGQLAFLGKEMRNVSIYHYTRIIFEFTEKAAMGLRFENSVKNMNGEKRRKVIVADHLTTPPEYKGNPRFSGPDMTFEGYYFQDGKWKYESILDIKLEQ